MDISEKGQRPFDKDLHTRLRDQASKPLAPFDAWSWGEVQMWDNGPPPAGAHAYVRFKLKIRHSTAPVQHLLRVRGRQALGQPPPVTVIAFMHAVAERATRGRTKTRPRRVAVVRGGRGTASRTVGLLGAIMAYAIGKGWRRDNPVRGVAGSHPRTQS